LIWLLFTIKNNMDVTMRNSHQFSILLNFNKRFVVNLTRRLISLAGVLYCVLFFLVPSAWGASASDPSYSNTLTRSATTKSVEQLLEEESKNVEPPSEQANVSVGKISTWLKPPPLTGIHTNCPSGVPQGRIGLVEVVTRALCSDPRTRQTWNDVRAQAAQLGIERAAFQPTVDGSVDAGRDRQWLNENAATQEGAASEHTVDNTGSASLDFTWMLFDFGQRAAAVKSAHQTLLAATAAHDETVQTVFLDAASAYYNLISAENALSVAQEVEQFTRHTLADAKARSKKGDDDVDESDMLQAQSSAAEATLDRIRAEGDLQEARGELAVLLGLTPDIKLVVNIDDAPVPTPNLVRSIDELMEEARVSHPAIRAAQARVDAARADVDEAKHRYAPTLSLVQENSWERDVWGGVQRDNSLDLQLNIPFYQGSRRYHKQAAIADLDSARDDVVDAKQTVAQGVWTAYQRLKTETAALEHTKPMIETARKLLQVEQKLYRKGDGDMLDLLYAQQNLADASAERLETLTAWRIARLKLAASLGGLGFWTIREPTTNQ
jgi:outer membrane protein